MQKNTLTSLQHYTQLLVIVGILLACAFAVKAARQVEFPQAVNGMIGAPPAGKMYHGVYPGSLDGKEEEITLDEIQQYEALAGGRVAWVYFSNNWYHNRRFPVETATMVREHGAVPYIRLMLRSSPEVNIPDPVFSPAHIVAGDFDADFTAWAKEAQRFSAPLLVEYGTECNGEWFAWNGKWHAEDPQDEQAKAVGAALFAKAYRHIVEVMRQAGATNITWVFHVSSTDDPNETWNSLEEYYPGDDVVDWLAVSIYGAQSPMDEHPESFRSQMDDVYDRLTVLAPDKPIIVAEFGCTANDSVIQPDLWAKAALNSLFSGRWPHIIGFSWWNERFMNDEDPAHESIMRLQDLPALADVFRSTLTKNVGKVQTGPVVGE